VAWVLLFNAGEARGTAFADVTKPTLLWGFPARLVVGVSKARTGGGDGNDGMTGFRFVLGFAFLGVLACGTDGITISSETPPLQEVSRGDVRTRMRQLATRVEELESIMWSDTALEPEDHARVALLLKQMSDIALSLEPIEHPDLARLLPKLQRDPSRALGASSLDPPNYYYAGEVSGACTYCHESRHDRGPLLFDDP
jgi:hypothetical protein